MTFKFLPDPIVIVADISAQMVKCIHLTICVVQCGKTPSQVRHLPPSNRKTTNVKNICSPSLLKVAI